MRKLGLIAAVILFGTVVSISALAETPVTIPSPQNSEADKAAIEKGANFYSFIAKTFGCPKFAWGSYVDPRHKVMSIEFIPDGDDVNSWTRLMTITTNALPNEQSAQIETMRNIQSGLLGGYSKGKILDEQTYKDSEGYPRLYVEYEIGEGIQKEHSAGAFVKLLPTASSFIQIQSRGMPFNKADADNMKLFAQSKLPIPTSH